MIKYTYTSNSLGMGTLLKAFIHKTEASTGRNKFIKKIADFFSINVKNVFLFASARMGLYTFLKAVNISKDDEVILPGYTCVVVSNAVKYSGAKAVYADIDINTLNIDYNDLIQKITSRTKVIVISHNFGLACSYIEKLKSTYPHIYIVEDCAHTFGSKYKGRLVGRLADASFISHEYSKVFTTGLGGTFIINNEKVLSAFSEEYQNMDEYSREDIRKILLSLTLHTLTSYQYTTWLKRYFFAFLRRTNLIFASGSDELQGKMPLQYPVKLDNTLAYIGALELDNIHQVLEHNKKLAQAYHEVFSGLQRIKDYYDEDAVYVRYPIVIEDAKHLDSIIKKLSKKTEFSIGRWFNDVVHPKGSFRYCYESGVCQYGEELSDKMINFPMTIHMDVEDIMKNQRALREVLQ